MSQAPPKSLVQSQFGQNAANYLTSTVHAKGASLARLIELGEADAAKRHADIEQFLNSTHD